MGHLKKVDWENLAKNLQEALSKEMKEVERLEGLIADLNEEIASYRQACEHYEGESTSSYVQNKNKNAIICYLENRLYEEMAKNRRIQDGELPF